MRAGLIAATVIVLGVSLSVAETAQFRDPFKVEQGHDDPVDPARLVGVAVEVLEDEGYRIELQDEDAGRVTTEWLTLHRLSTRVGVGRPVGGGGEMQTRISVSVGPEETMLSLVVSGRRRHGGGRVELPGGFQDTAEELLTLIVKKLSQADDGRESHSRDESVIPR